MIKYFRKIIKSLFIFGHSHQTRPFVVTTFTNHETAEKDIEESVTNLVIKEFARRITPGEQDELDLLVSKCPEFKALRAEIHMQLSNPRVAYYLEQLARYSLPDAKERLNKQKREIVGKRITAVAAMVTKAFSWTITLPAIGILVLSCLLSKDLILSALLSILAGLAAKLVAICISASEAKAEQDTQKIADNIEAWLAFHGFPEMCEENLPAIIEQLFSMSQDPEFSNQDRKLAAFLLTPTTGRTAKNDNEEPFPH